MLIQRARTAGFCMGVSLALQKLSAALRQHSATAHSTSPARLVMLGPIIHNPEVLESFMAQGVVCANGMDDIHPGDTVVIRAHGIPRHDENRLHELKAHIIDATCPKVKKAQLAIAEATASSTPHLLLFGEEDHPEVRGLVSYACGSCEIFSATLPDSLPEGPVVLAAQTTQDRALFEQLSEELLQRHTDARVLSTICDATAKRQKETVDIARKVDMMLVIGGHESGNTRRLVDVAKSAGAQALHVERMNELPPAHVLLGYEHIGLTAGASTPRDHVDAIEHFLHSLARRTKHR